MQFFLISFQHLGTAIEWFTRDVIKGMETTYYQVGEVGFAKT